MIRRRLTDRDLTGDIIRKASQILNELFPRELGAEKEFTSGGNRYVGVLERHYHPPGGAAKPWGPHKGISTFELIDGDESPETLRATGKFILGPTSLSRLSGVHPDLARVVKRAIEITPIDFSVVEGLRTSERQRQLVAQGKSQTMASRHITGHAVDLAPYEGGQIHWDWPRFRKLAPSVLDAAKELGIAVTWGGNWASFPDGPHFELSRKAYP